MVKIVKGENITPHLVFCDSSGDEYEPKYSTDYSAGFELYAADDVDLTGAESWSRIALQRLPIV